VSSKFHVGPERAGNWDVRGHRSYAGLLQAATRNSFLSAVMLGSKPLSHSILIHVMFPEILTLTEVKFDRTNLI
jgi:hypothetical protein